MYVVVYSVDELPNDIRRISGISNTSIDFPFGPFRSALKESGVKSIRSCSNRRLPSPVLWLGMTEDIPPSHTSAIRAFFPYICR